MTGGILSVVLLFAGILPAAGQDSSAVVPLAADSVVSADSGSAVRTDSVPQPGRDSLQAGVKADTGITIIRRNCISPAFSFMIPIIKEFEKLRSEEENRFVIQHWDQDAEDRFDENDICFPAGAVVGRVINRWVQVRAGAFFYSIANANAWTPRPGDTLYKEKTVNVYSLRALHVSVEAQFNISRALLTVNNFNRVYLTVLGEYFPLIILKTERTELGKGINGRGTGFGQGAGVGIERYLSEKTSLTGELGYSLSTLEHFKDGRTVRFSDIFVNGRDEEFFLTLKSLGFRFLFNRWF
jgi:hypothetical protein